MMLGARAAKRTAVAAATAAAARSRIKRSSLAASRESVKTEMIPRGGGTIEEHKLSLTTLAVAGHD